MKTRFIKNIVATATSTNTPMPWTRGVTRQASIAKRREDTSVRKTA